MAPLTFDSQSLFFALGQQSKTLNSLSTTFLRLSSGLRINSASDDPAGLAVAGKLESDSRVYSKALGNINEGISLLNIASGALDALNDITNRKIELATEASNGNITTAQRSALNDEANNLVDEYNRIVSTTSYNGIPLLDILSAPNSIGIQAGRGTANTIPITTAAGLSYSVGTGSFTLVSSYGTNTNPSSVTTGDFNGDGKLDYVTADYYDNKLSVRLGNGDGTFSLPGSFTTGFDPLVVQTADVNGDGKLDLISANRTSQTITILQGNGDGTFKAAVSYDGGLTPSGLEVADFTGDGKADVVVTDAGDDTVGILVNNGDGTFAARVAYDVPGGTTPHGVDSADVNGDGAIDLVVAGKDINGVVVLLGNGNGTFQAAETFDAGVGPERVALGDLNGDGKVDIATTDYSTGGVSILLGNGDGTFLAQTTLTGGSQSLGIRLADLNSDGNLDIVDTEAGANKVTILLGNGDGTFKSRISFATGGKPFDVAAGDFNGDGALDLVTANRTGNNGTVFLASTALTSQSKKLNLLTADSAGGELSGLNDELNRVAVAKGVVGAGLARLSAASEVVDASRLAVDAAKSRIVDVDVAQETANLLKLQILSQQQTAVIAQANLQPSLVLSLISGSFKTGSGSNTTSD